MKFNTKMDGGFSDKSRVRLYSELRLLIHAGLDVKSAVELLMQEAVGFEQKLLRGIDRNLIVGKSLSQAVNDFGGFSNYEVYSLRIGEETGEIESVLLQLELFYARKMKLKRQLISAMSYPIFVLCLSIGVVYFMLNNIVPMFADIFKRFGGDLPPLTKALLQLSNATRNYAWIIFLVVAAVGVYIYLNRNEKKVRIYSARFVLMLPFIGVTVRKIYLARFCQVMSLLSAAKVPLTEAIAMVEHMIGFYPLEASMGPIKKQLTNGVSLHKALGQFPIYEKRMVALIKVSEEVNQLDTMFDQIAVQYNEDIDQQTKVVSSVLEPLMIVVIASVVGLILVAMYLPLFKLSTTIG